MASVNKAVYDHYWFWVSRLPERKNQRCRVFARAKLNTIGVEFEDGFRVATSRYAVRKIQEVPHGS